MHESTWFAQAKHLQKRAWQYVNEEAVYLLFFAFMRCSSFHKDILQTKSSCFCFLPGIDGTSVHSKSFPSITTIARASPPTPLSPFSNSTGLVRDLAVIPSFLQLLLPWSISVPQTLENKTLTTIFKKNIIK